MKKLWTLMAMVAVFASCSQEEADSPLNTYTLTGYADVESRTAFGTPGTNKIPFQWSAGDYIYNGTNKSNALSNGGSSADFTFSGTPSSNEVYYNISGTSAKEANVKNAQTIGNLGTNGDFGYGTVSNGSFTLKHATSYLWFNVTSSLSNVTLQSVKVSADVNIAGKATWNGNSLGSVSEGKTSIELTVGQALSSTNDNVWAMVVLPNLANQSFKVTYKLKVGEATKYYSQTITGISTFTSGKTQKVSLTIDNSTPLTDYAELRVLTFEDTDAKFTPYSLDYANKTINNWSDLVDDAQYGGTLTYNNNNGGATYYWYDENNTELEHSFTTPYWGGGHAISNFVIENYETLPSGYYGWYQLQFANPIGGHNGSSNFAVHNGYSDFFNSQIYDASLKGFGFEEGVERVVDHMYVTNTCYVLNSLTCGDGFNTPATNNTWVKIVAYGYNAEEALVGTTEFYLCNTGKQIVTDWQKWDLSSLGKVNKIVFNFAASADQSGSYGLNCPAYFAYDDVAVQFTE